MKHVNVKGMDMSVFTLGTVQLGMDYGLGEHTQKPPKEAAFALLDRAVACGVNALDTANNYGDSERTIGEWLRMKRPEDRPYVITKIGPFDQNTKECLRDDIFRQAEKSLQTLNADTLDMLMVHAFEDYVQNPDIVANAFADLKAQGIIKRSALSAYSRHDYKVLSESGFDAVQIPLNVFDWSQIESGGIRLLTEAHMAVFVRSVFLQGLVFLKPEEVDPRMDFCVPYLRKYLALCEEFGLSPATLALSFALSVPGVTSVVLGCQTIEQLENNCELIDQTVTLTEAQMERIHAAFRGIDPRVINPGCWFNHT